MKTNKHENFVKRVDELVSDEYTVLGEYTNARNKIEMRHESCGNEYSVRPDAFLNANSRCPRCFGKNRKTNEEFLKEVAEVTDGDYIFTDTYVNHSTKLSCTHTVCGNSWGIVPASFLDKGTRCPYCAGNKKMSNEDFLKRVVDEIGCEYEFVEEYKNFVTPIECVHECGHRWMLAPNNLFQGKRCPRCINESKGEEFVRSVLEENNIYFKQQHKFEDCKHINHLPFDFYIKSLNLAIEYDGEQHFKPVNFGGRGKEKSQKSFEITVKRDGIKNNYCETNGINLLRIPYHLEKEEAKSILESTIQSRSKAE